MKLLIAYDGSEHAKIAIGELRNAGLPAKAEAVVVTVADVWPNLIAQPGTAEDPLANLAIQRLTRRARDEANRAMSDARQLASHGAERLKSTFPTWTIGAEAIAGQPSWKLIQRAEELGSDLLVVGSQGHSVVSRALLGSVSQQVLHHASCSVRVSRTSNFVEGKNDRPTRILLAVDGSPGSASAVSAVAGRQWRPGSRVSVMTVSDYRVLLYLLGCGVTQPTPPPGRGDADEVDRYALRRLKEVCNELTSQGLLADAVVREGDPKLEIVREANDWGADCVFLGAHGMSRVERLLIGSVSAAVAARAHCSVEVIRF